jgi:hypothetical protein
MMPETGVVEVEIQANNETLCTHRALWTTGQVYSIIFPVWYAIGILACEIFPLERGTHYLQYYEYDYQDEN